MCSKIRQDQTPAISISTLVRPNSGIKTWKTKLRTGSCTSRTDGEDLVQEARVLEARVLDDRVLEARVLEERVLSYRRLRLGLFG